MWIEAEPVYGALVSLAIGLIIGLERGWQVRQLGDNQRIAGMRTYGLIGLLGGVCALLLPTLRGAFCLTFMDENTLYAARDPQGVRPLVLGRLERGWVVASETAALDIVGASFVREVEPGEFITIDENGYHASVDGESLNLTYTEFELLRFLAQSPGRVFSREQILADVWGYDYYGGTRTVDVHVRRLRAKLGPEHEALIGTVRNVGYRLEEQE